MVSLLASCLEFSEPRQKAELLVTLDVGAGNGIVGQELRIQLKGRIRYLVGTDIIPEARKAAVRDRPEVYDQYIVADLLADSEKLVPKQGSYDILVICAAFGPGWGDMPIETLRTVRDLLESNGFLAITVHEKWLESERVCKEERDRDLWDNSVARLAGRDTKLWSDLTVLERKRYGHRLDMRDEWIWYQALVLQKA